MEWLSSKFWIFRFFFKFQSFKIFFRILQLISLYKKDRSRKKEQKMQSDFFQNFEFLGSLGGQPGSYCIPQPCLVHWVVSQAPIIYPNCVWFAGWSARFLLFTPDDSGSLGWSVEKSPKKLKFWKKVTPHFLLLFSWSIFFYNDISCKMQKENFKNFEI